MEQISEQINDLKELSKYLDAQELLNSNIFSSDMKHPTNEYLSDDKLVLVGRTKVDKKGERFEKHCHKYNLEFIVLLSGELNVYFPGKSKKIKLSKPLDYCTIDYGEIHSGLVTKDNT